MWSCVRIDLGWRDLASGIINCLLPGRADQAASQLEHEWSQWADDALVSLSVRSAFDLLLAATKFPPGSEVLFSGITIGDMPQIARHHGLVPVEVPVCEPDGRLDLQALKSLVSAKTKMLVVAQLFGHRFDLAEIRAATEESQVMLVEDCAQAWFHRQWRGSAQADVSLFSFGLLKTATAVGGALARVADPHLLASMRKIQQQYPQQSQTKYGLKLLKAGFLKLLSSRPVLRAFGWVKLDVLQFVARQSRGFSQQQLVRQLRLRPSRPLMQMLRRRLLRYPYKRIEQRCSRAKLISRLLNGVPGISVGISTDTACESSHWVVPVFTHRPYELQQHLKRYGFQGVVRGNLKTIGEACIRSPEVNESVSDTSSARLLKRALFVPCYVEMPEAEVRRMCAVISHWCQADCGADLAPSQLAYQV